MQVNLQEIILYQVSAITDRTLGQPTLDPGEYVMKNEGKKSFLHCYVIATFSYCIFTVGMKNCIFVAAGGLFQLSKKKKLSAYHAEDTSLLLPTFSGDKDWASLSSVVKKLFVTGDWGSESAQARLDEDDALFGDFEDLETGEQSETKPPGEEAGDEETDEAEKTRLENKKRLKEAFDAGYDEEEGGGYLEDLKREVTEQEQRNRAEFEGMDDKTRQQLEGIRPGHYVRIVLKGNLCLGLMAFTHYADYFKK